MRRIYLLTAALVLLSFAAGRTDYAIVNNSTSGQTAHDSLSIPFFLLDSAGNQVAIASGDSVFLTIWYPGGALAFADSGAYNDADITSQVQGGVSFYSWRAQVSDLDGTPTEGTYKYHFSVHDKTSADLWTPFTGSFQLYATSDFDKVLDSIGLAQIEVENIDAWNPLTDNDSLIVDQSTLEDMTVATVTDVTNQVTADVTAISGDAEAADSLEEACDGYDDAGLSLFERIVAQQAVLNLVALYTGACDSCYQILYPRSGATNKDSVVVFDKDDTKIAKVVFMHGTVPSVYDTSYYYIAPWWE